MTAPVSPPKVDTSERAEDIRDETGQRYSRTELQGGAGLDFLHSPSERPNTSTRFWDSKGIEVFDTERGKPYGATLQHLITLDQASGQSFQRIGQIDGTVYYIHGITLYEYPSTSRHVFTGLVVKEMVVLGNTLYVLDDTNGVSRIVPGTWTPVVTSATVYDTIWAIKGRIVASLDNLLYEVVDGGADTLIDTLASSELVHDMVDLGAAAVALCSDQTMRAYTLGSSQSLEPSGITRIPGETPLLGAVTEGVLGYATRASTEAGGTVVRFYTAELDASADNTLTNRQLIYQRGNRFTTVDLTPTSIFPTRDSIYLAVPEEDTDEVSLWRHYLPTGGYARDLTFDFQSALDVGSMVEVDDRFYVCVPTSGIWLEQDLHVASGYVVGPLADHFTAEPKQWIAGRLSGDTVPAGGSIELYDSTDPSILSEPYSASWRLVAKLFAGTDQTEVDTLSGRNSRFHVGKLIMRSDAGGAVTPEFRSYSFRSLPNASREMLLRLPINISDQFESPHRRVQVRKGRGLELESALRAFEGEHTIVELFRRDLQVRGLVETIEVPVETIAPRGSVTRIMWVTIRGKRIEDSSGFGNTTLGQSLGLNILGLTKLGVGKQGT